MQPNKKLFKVSTLVLLFLINTQLLFSQSIGSQIIVLAADGKTFNAVIKDIFNNQYLVQNDGFETRYWVNRNQFKLLEENSTKNETKPKLSETPINKEANLNVHQQLKTIYNFGYQNGWANTLYNNKFNSFIQKFTDNDQQALLNFLNQAKTASARFFALKSLITGDTYETIQKFINQLNQQTEEYQQDKCLMTTQNSLVQQWQFSCSITIIQTFLADLSPRYAWDLKHINNFDKNNYDPNSPIAKQQKELLEKYGGSATVRGDVTGTSIGIIAPLKELVTPILGVDFYAQEVTEPLPVLFTKIRQQLDKGINMPLLINFGDISSRHFILAMRYQNTNEGFQYLIYDPWEGKCKYVLESTILQGSLSPILDQHKINIDYYYPFS